MISVSYKAALANLISGMDNFQGSQNLIKVFCLPSEKGLKRNGSYFVPFRLDILSEWAWRRGFQLRLECVQVGRQCFGIVTFSSHK